MLTFPRLKALSALLACASFPFAGGAYNVYWDFTGGTAAPSSPPIAGLTASTVSVGNNRGTTTMLTTTFPSSGYVTAAGLSASGSYNAGASAFNGALNLGTSTYFAFGLSAGIGNPFVISGISSGVSAVPAGPITLSLYSSADGFGTDFTFLGSVGLTTNLTWAAKDFGILSTPLDANSSVAFRLYASDGAGFTPDGFATLRLDDLAVIVTEIPEPSPLLFWALGAVIAQLQLSANLRHRRAQK